MLSTKQMRRAHRILVLIGLILAGYYFFMFRPIAQHAAALDEPLRAAWQKLAAAKISSNSNQELNSTEIAKNLAQAKSAVVTVRQAGKKIEDAVVLDTTVREKMAEPFQLVDFQIEELVRIEELGRAAQQHQVSILPAVFSNFPEYRADRGEPELLWGQLAFLHHLLSTAVQCKVTTIQNIDLPAYIAHPQSTNAPAYLYEVPVNVELTGSMESVSRLLASLPLRAEEMKAANLPEVSPGKPSLFIHRIVLSKNSPENPDEARLELRACGFIYRN